MLKDFLGAPGKDYREIILREKKAKGLHSQADCTAMWLHPRIFAIGDNTTTARFVRERLKGAPLIDVGGATGRFGEFAVTAGASAYINVDLYPLGGLHDLGEDPEYDLIPPESAFKNNTQRLSVCADMLDFISRVPGQSVNIMINGIDELIVRTTEYHKALAQEMVRTVRPDGVILGYNSASLRYAEQLLTHRFYSKEQMAQSGVVFGKHHRIFVMIPAEPQLFSNPTRPHETQIKQEIATRPQIQ
ncbi:MAG: hypothetical protein PHY92_04135 [Alphaproteobacteria bacterium]|nr:hypothetical protein [Alphaproteobacteria bacterium]